MAIDPMKSHGFHGQTGPKRWPIALLERARAVPEESPGGRRALESPPIGESGGKMVDHLLGSHQPSVIILMILGW